MSGEIKVTYFNSKGRAEATRLLLKLAKKPFVDCRVEGEEWQKLKPCKSFTDSVFIKCSINSLLLFVIDRFKTRS